MEQALLTAGLFVLGFALRSFAPVWSRKLGAVIILGATYVGGYFLGGNNHVAGAISVSVWLFLPWLEIIGRVRGMRLPLRRELAECPEPRWEEFPNLRSLTKEIEECGYEQHQDLGWEHGNFSQFLRLFLSPDARTLASVSLSRQGEGAIVHISLTTREDDGRVFRTTNLPFSDTMAVPPDVLWQRDLRSGSFAEFTAAHALFLGRGSPRELITLKPSELPDLLQMEAARQVDHNLQRGFITPADATTFRYSWRGCFFLWWRVIGDMVRLA
ncbi:MAG: hypothetical protein ACKO2G_01195 [Verrucomicrobiales bacterium]